MNNDEISLLILYLRIFFVSIDLALPYTSFCLLLFIYIYIYIYIYIITKEHKLVDT